MFKTFLPSTYRQLCMCSLEKPMSCISRKRLGGCGSSSAKNEFPKKPGQFLCLAIGSTSVVASIIMAFLAVRERNLTYLKQQQGRSDESVSATTILDSKILGENFLGGNRMHFLHSFAIIAAPYASANVFLTTGLFLSGIALYSGAQYKRSFNRQPESLKPILWAGGALLLAGWLSFLL